jgi:tRNA-dihydrouridine synthase A
MIDRRFSVAPMMERTDRFFRFFARLLTRRALLYTEMLTANAVLRGDRARLLAFDRNERPVALQLGGSDPADMAAAATIGEDFGYDEININVGCPSDRVQAGRFGACLMAEPEIVADCVAAIRARVSIPVTVKTRIGIDERDSYEDLTAFVSLVAAAGCASFAIHARKAWLSGLSPKENREIPPLRYDLVYRLAADFPRLSIVLNGGIRDLDEAARHMDALGGVMMGRAAFENPFLLAAVDRRLFGDAAPIRTRAEAVHAYAEFAARERARGVPLAPLVKPIIPLFHGAAGGRAWRRHLSSHAHRPGAGVETILAALADAQVMRAAA